MLYKFDTTRFMRCFRSGGNIVCARIWVDEALWVTTGATQLGKNRADRREPVRNYGRTVGTQGI